MSRMKRYAETLWPDEPVSVEEARVWVARCRATLIGATLSAKLRSSSSSGEKEEER